MSARVVADSSEALTLKQLKKRLYGQLKDTGVVDTLRTQLRSQLVREIRSKALGAKLEQKLHSELSLKNRVLNSLVTDYLQSCGFGYTLSIFVPESGLSKLILNKTDLLQVLRIDPESHMYARLLGSVEDTENATTESSLLFRIFDSLPGFGQHARDSQTQTEVDIYQRSIESQLDQIDHQHALRASQSGLDQGSVEERMLAYKAECDERVKSEIAQEVARFREHELVQMRAQEQQAARDQIEQAEQRFEAMYEEQMKKGREREGVERERVGRREKELEKSNYDLRQRLMQQMENIKTQESDLKRQSELNDRAAQIEQQRLREKELSLTEQQAQVEQEKVRLRKEADARFADFKLDLQNTYEEKGRSLRRDFALLEEQRAIFTREKDSHAVLLSEASNVREDLRDAQLRIERLQEELRLSHERLRTQAETSAMEKSDHAQLLKDSTLMKSEAERLRRTLLDQKSETHSRVQELELLSARLTHELTMAKEDLATEKAARNAAVDDARSESRQTYQAGLTEWKRQEQDWALKKDKLESERNIHLKELSDLRRKLEEAELTSRSTARELSDMRMLFRQTQAVLGENGMRGADVSIKISPRLAWGPKSTPASAVRGDPGARGGVGSSGARRRLRITSPTQDIPSNTGQAQPVLSTKDYADFDAPTHSGPPTAADMAQMVGSALGADWVAEVEVARRNFALLEEEDARLREIGDAFVHRVTRDERQTVIESVELRGTTRGPASTSPTIEQLPSTPQKTAGVVQDDGLAKWAQRTTPKQQRPDVGEGVSHLSPIPVAVDTPTPAKPSVAEIAAKQEADEEEQRRQEALRKEREAFEANQDAFREEMERKRVEFQKETERVQREHAEQIASLEAEKAKAREASARQAQEAMEAMEKMAQEAESNRKKAEEERRLAEERAEREAEKQHKERLAELQRERDRVAAEEAERREAFERRMALEEKVIREREQAAKDAAAALEKATEAAITAKQERVEEAERVNTAEARQQQQQQQAVAAEPASQTSAATASSESAGAATATPAKAVLRKAGRAGDRASKSPSSTIDVMSFSASATPVRGPRPAPISPIAVVSSGSSEDSGDRVRSVNLSASQTPKRTTAPSELSGSVGVITSPRQEEDQQEAVGGDTDAPSPKPVELDPVQAAIERERQRVAEQRAQEQAWRAQAIAEREEAARKEAEEAREAEAKKKAEEQAAIEAEEERRRNDPLEKYKGMVAEKRLKSADSRGDISEGEVSGFSGTGDSIAGVESMSGDSSNSGW